MTRTRMAARWIVTTAALSITLAWLHALGARDLGLPSMTVDDVRQWLADTDTAVAVFAIVRGLAIVTGWYLVVVTTLGFATRLLALRRAASIVDRLTLPLARGVFGGIATFGALAGPAPTVPAPAPSTGPDVAVLHEASNTDDVATLHLVTEPPSPSPLPVAPAVEPAPYVAPAADTWVVEPGESLWSIAAAHLSDVRGGAVPEREIASYWRDLVEANRSRLVNPHDADLLFVGQTVELPAVG